MNLSKREQQVLNLRLKGLKSEAVAREIGRSKRTVDFHLANIYKKVGATNLIEAGLKLGLINNASTGG